MVHLDNKDKYEQDYSRSHEQLVNTHDEQITRLLLQVQQLAIRIEALEKDLGKHIYDTVTMRYDK